MISRLRILCWVMLAFLLLATLAEAGFFTRAEGVVTGKRVFHIWGFPMGGRLVIKYQEPTEKYPGILLTRYKRIPVTHSVYEKFKKGDKLAHHKFSFTFFRNDESVSFSWDTRWTFSMVIFAFLLFAAFQSERHRSRRASEYKPIVFFPPLPEIEENSVDEKEMMEDKRRYAQK